MAGLPAVPRLASLVLIVALASAGAEGPRAQPGAPDPGVLDRADAWLAAGLLGGGATGPFVVAQGQVALVRDLLRGGASGEPDLAGAAGLARLASERQARVLGLAPLAPPLSAASPRAAALRVLDVHGVAPSDADLAALGTLDRMPPELSSVLAALLDAYASFASAAADVVDPADLGAVLASRSALLDAAVALAQELPRHNLRGASVVAGGLLVLELDGVDSLHVQDAALLVDAGGDDVYRNNAGGTCRMPATMLLDLAGDDRYLGEGRCGVNGGAGFDGTAGFLLDVEGRDEYRAGGLGVNGGAYRLGAGFLLDAGGDDDRYVAEGYGANGGAEHLASGLLFDAGGNDVYIATAGLATNGGAFDRASGILVDAGAGHDTYLGGSAFGVNGGGAEEASGFVFDGGGDDAYGSSRAEAPSLVVNGGGGWAGVGLLYDHAGNDRYQAGDVAVNGGAWGGVGLLLDRAGDDAYTAGGGGVNGGAHHGTPCPLFLVCLSTSAPFGLLLDAGGRDVYADDDGGAGTDKTVLAKGLLGNQLDLPSG